MTQQEVTRMRLYGQTTTGDLSEPAQLELRAKVPAHTLASLDRYVSQHYQPGGFLIALLSNDLKEACGRADDKNQHALFDIVAYIYNLAPASCWGSASNVAAWLEIGRRVRDNDAEGSSQQSS